MTCLSKPSGRGNETIAIGLNRESLLWGGVGPCLYVLGCLVTAHIWLILARKDEGNDVE